MSNQNIILDECGCCEGIKPLTPAELENSPGLSALAYRVGTHGSFKKTMHSALSTKPALGKLTTRDDDDPAVSLLDGWAAVLDVLTFYQERIANEAYLRTATERRSVLELARHISYKLRPGTAAGTYLAFTMEDAPGAPSEAVISVGTRAQSVPGQDERPQVFETVEEIEAKVRWNQLKPRTSVLKYPVYDDSVLYLKGTSTELKEGDALLIIGGERKTDHTNDNWDFRKVKAVDTVPPSKPGSDPDAGFTKVTLDRGLGSVIPYGEPARQDTEVYALRQQAALFGYNAPDWKAMPDNVKKAYWGVDAGGTVPGNIDEWPGLDIASITDPPPTDSRGLYGEYYDVVDFTNFKGARLDPEVDFDWADGKPHPQIGSDTFSVRWTGWLKPPSTGNYIFYTESDDGVRLWVNGQLVINNWTDHSHTWDQSDPISLTAGTMYDIKLEYYEKGGKAVIRLYWQEPDVKKKTAVPRNRLYPRFIHTVHLDAVYKKIAGGGWLVLSLPNKKEVYSIEAAAEDSRTGFTLSSKTTRVILKGEYLRRYFNDKVRETVVYAQSEKLEIAETPITDPVEGKEIVLDSVVSDLEEEQKLIITGKRVRGKISQKCTLKWNVLPGQPKVAVPFNPGDELIITGPPTPVKGYSNIQRWYLRGILVINGKNQEIEDDLILPNGLITYTQSDEDDDTVSEFIELSSLEAEDDTHTKLVLTESLENVYDRATVTISANVARATHGETKTEVLGSGDGSKTFQEFRLKQKPLTYVSAATAEGTETTLEIRVNDILWKEVPTFYGVSSEERVYITRIADDGTVTVQFGDGITGARLPTGSENVKATYRVGTGLDGHVKAEQISLLMTPQLGVKGVINPQAPSGADDPETLENARRNAPVTVLTLDRIVSLWDYEDFTNAYSGIGKARVAVLWKGEQRIVHITVAAADEGGVDETSDLYKNLVAAIDAARHPDHQVRIDSFRPLTFKVKARVLVDDDYIAENVLAAVSDAMEEAFAFKVRDFGQDVTPSEVTAVIQGVEGVVAVDLEKLDGRDPFEEEHFRLTAETADWDQSNEGNILAAQLLTINPNGIDLTEMTK